MKKEELQAKIAAVGKRVVGEQATKTGHQSWGGSESLALVAALVSTLIDEVLEAEGTDGAYVPTFADIAEGVEAVINPSAFRQKLSKLPATDPRYVVEGEKGKRTSKALAMLA